jgi:DNA-directed RNA polymerase subunit RPC12/RpoP
MALKQIICPECGKRLLLEVETEGREYRCPVCGALFRAVRQNGALMVLFEGAPAYRDTSGGCSQRRKNEDGP